MSTDSDEGLGSLLEISRGGKQPIELASGETRSFLEDGDEVTLRAWCERDGAVRIGLASASGASFPQQVEAFPEQDRLGLEESNWQPSFSVHLLLARSLRNSRWLGNSIAGPSWACAGIGA